MDEFFYDGEKLIEDRGNAQKYYSGSGDKYSIDEYVWLAGMPVAVLKSTFRDDWSRNPSDVYAAGCLRNDEAEACGKFFIINDGLPKPVAMLDGDGRLVGTGEYDVFGRVNTVTRIADSPAQPGFDAWPFGNYLANQDLNLVSMYETQRGTGHQVQARVNYAAIHTSGPTDKAWVESRTGRQVLAPEVSGELLGAKDTAWFQVPFNDYVDVRWVSDSVQETSMYPYNGVVVAGWEYRHYEAGTAPRWTPLRFPGQYVDAESGLFENWNRFYEPATGRYMAADPIALASDAVVPEVYGYALNNPIRLADPSGLLPNVAEVTVLRLASAQLRLSLPTWEVAAVSSVAPAYDSGTATKLKLVEAILRGDWNAAASLAAILGGAYPAAINRLQAAFAVANQRAGPCYKVADGIAKGFKELGMKAEHVFLRTGVASGPGGIIGRRMSDGTWRQVSTTGEHAVILRDGRYYDAFTGPAGEVVADYMSRISSGMAAFPVRPIP